MQQTTFDKKSYLTYLKVSIHRECFEPLIYFNIVQGYMKVIKAKLVEENPDRVEIFERQATLFAKKVVGDFKNYDLVSLNTHLQSPQKI